jgi:hypothetical protein
MEDILKSHEVLVSRRPRATDGKILNFAATMDLIANNTLTISRQEIESLLLSTTPLSLL